MTLWLVAWGRPQVQARLEGWDRASLDAPAAAVAVDQGLRLVEGLRETIGGQLERGKGDNQRGLRCQVDRGARGV